MQGRIPAPVPDGLTAIETMRAEPDGSVRLWHLHRARLRRDCAAVGFPLDETALIQVIGGIGCAETARRVRLTVDAAGNIALTQAPLPPNPPRWRVALSAVILNSADPWLRIKTSHRIAYDAARQQMPEGCDEVILLNEMGAVCEGTITTLFLRRGDRLLTPPLRCGLLPGVLRQSLLDTGQAIESMIDPGELQGAKLFCGNALRGLIPARLMAPSDAAR